MGYICPPALVAKAWFLFSIHLGKIWQPNTTMAVSCGTLAYVAPEAVSDTTYVHEVRHWWRYSQVLDKSYTSQCKEPSILLALAPAPFHADISEPPMTSTLGSVSMLTSVGWTSWRQDQIFGTAPRRPLEPRRCVLRPPFRSVAHVQFRALCQLSLCPSPSCPVRGTAHSEGYMPFSGAEAKQIRDIKDSLYYPACACMQACHMEDGHFSKKQVCLSDA